LWSLVVDSRFGRRRDIGRGCTSSAKSGARPTAPRGSATKARPAITIVAHDFKYQLPATVPSGYVDVTLKNEGANEHQAQIVKIGSVTLKNFAKVAVQTRDRRGKARHRVRRRHDISNQGTEAHELNLFELAPGVSLHQA
jgi:hypothetical protein